MVDDLSAARERRRNLIQQSVNALRSERSFRDWLRARKCFHHYSPLNVLHIAVQCPEATYVAGYRTWLHKLGYQVRKGEKGIVILVPHTRRETVEDQRTGEEREERRVYFRPGHVFDRSQVDPIPGEAKPLDPPIASAPVDGDSHAHLVGSFERFAVDLGFAVERRALPLTHGGFCDSQRKLICIREGQQPNAELRVLVHELAHALGIGYQEFGRERAEQIVECVTYMVCARAGLDVEAASVPYIAGWAADDAEAIERDAVLIDRLSRRLEKVIEAESTAGAARGMMEAA